MGAFGKKGGVWRLPKEHHQAHGIPPNATRWFTAEGDETFWEDLLSEGAVKEVF